MKLSSSIALATVLAFADALAFADVLAFARAAPFALASTAQGAPEASSAAPRARRALIVGIDDYQTGAAAGEGRGVRRFADLRGAVNDARAFREILQLRYGFEPKDVLLVTNAEATREGILGAFREHLIAQSAEGDLAVFYYAGHGSQIRNSKNPPTTPYDQTLVPYDSASGALDIWDKELVLLFNDLLDTGAGVTAFFDSCHSGSITRGLPALENARFAPEDGRDAAELYASVPVDERPWPVSRGALIFSAAQDTQTAKETSSDDGETHGIFSSALVSVLRTVPVDEPAQRVFLRTRAIMQSDGCSQEPVLGGILGDRDDDDDARPLFGAAPEGRSGALALAVQTVAEEGLVLAGGRALGLGAGTELRAAGEDGPLLRIESVRDLTSSLASVVAGESASIQPGDLFEITQWVPPVEAHLRVWISPRELGRDELDALAAVISELGGLDGVHLVEDPAATAPTHVARLGREGWELASAGGTTALGDTLEADAIEAALRGRGPVELFVDVPPLVGLAAELAFSDVDADSSVEVVASPADAHYLLVGRIAQGTAQYCWALPNGSFEADESRLALPVRTTWIACPEDADGRAVAVDELREHALRTGRVRAWLRLEGPPAEKGFPWRLALRDPVSKAILDSDALHDGMKIELVLVADELPRIPKHRYVYVFALDCHGKSELLYPPGGGSNRFPPPKTESAPERVYPLTSAVTVQKPFGTDTIVLLSTEEALSDARALEWAAVLEPEKESATRGVEKRSPLDRLLQSALGRTRSGVVGAPASWSISRMQIVTRPAPEPPSTQDRHP